VQFYYYFTARGRNECLESASTGCAEVQNFRETEGHHMIDVYSRDVCRTDGR